MFVNCKAWQPRKLNVFKETHAHKTEKKNIRVYLNQQDNTNERKTCDAHTKLLGKQSQAGRC